MDAWYKVNDIKKWIIAICATAAILSCNFVYGGIRDFGTSHSRVSINDFISGGPGKGGIPAISNPTFVSAAEAQFLKDDDLIIGFFRGKEARAYPLRILNWHEIVNDTVGELPIAITWCPLTKSAIVFNRRIRGKILTFGVSGLLYNSNLVMYDRESNGLWPQLALGAVTGKYSSDILNMEPSLIMAWRKWKDKHPRTLVLSEDTGFTRQYSRDPYYFYHKGPRTMFTLKHADNRLKPKSIVMGIKIRGISKAYPLEIIAKSDRPIEDAIDGVDIKIYASSESNAYITDKNGNLLSAITMYWFAWSAFNSDTLIFHK